jgi:hypothetical protein
MLLQSALYDGTGKPKPMCGICFGSAKLAVQLQYGPSTEDTKNSVFNEPLHLADEVLKFERTSGSKVLAKVNGRVSTLQSCGHRLSRTCLHH